MGTLLWALTFLDPSSAFAQSVVINEFLMHQVRAYGRDLEFIELLLLRDMTAAEVEQLIVGDADRHTEAKWAGYQFRGMADFADLFPAGTILTLCVDCEGLDEEDLSYDPFGGDWGLVLRADHNQDYFIDNGFDLNLTAEDLVYVDTTGLHGERILSRQGFAVNYDPTPGALGRQADVSITCPTDFTCALAAAVDRVTDPTAWKDLATWTMGEPNGGDNTASIEKLRDRFLTCEGPDTDGDGVCDRQDRCPDVADPSNADFDGDGIGDVCDVQAQLLETQPGVPGVPNTFAVVDGPPNVEAWLYLGGGDGTVSFIVPGTPCRFTLDMTVSASTVEGTTDATGAAEFVLTPPAGAAGKVLLTQVLFPELCLVTNVVKTQL